MIYGTLRIDGMSCSSCSSSIESYIRQLGCHELTLFSISLLESKAKVKIEALKEPANATAASSLAVKTELETLDKILEAIQSLGFGVSIDSILHDHDRANENEVGIRNELEPGLEKQRASEPELRKSLPPLQLLDRMRTLHLTLSATPPQTCYARSSELSKAFQTWMHTDGSAFLLPTTGWSVKEASAGSKTGPTIRVSLVYEADCSLVPFYLALAAAFLPHHQINIENEHDRDVRRIQSLAKLWLCKSFFCLFLLFVQLILCFFLAPSPVAGWIKVVFSSLLIASPVGCDFFIDGFRRLFLARRVNMSLVISLAVLLGYVVSIVDWIWPQYALGDYFETCESLLLFTTLGKALELTAKRWTLQKLSAVEAETEIRGCPDASCHDAARAPMAHLIIPNAKAAAQIYHVPVVLLQKGDRVRIYSGERIPVDGTIICTALSEEPWSSKADDAYYPIDQSILTGEAKPILMRVGDSVLAGSVYQSGQAEDSPCSATAAPHVDLLLSCADADSSLSRMTGAARDASLHGRPHIQGLADKISLYFLPTLVSLSLLSFFMSYYYWHASLPASLSRAMAVLMISCPCSLGLAAPMATAVGMSTSRRTLKTLVKASDAFERAASVSTVLFDKTGTLTTGNMKVAKVLMVQDKQANPMAAHDEKGCASDLVWQAVLEVESQYTFHPIARALAAYAQSHCGSVRGSFGTPSLFIDHSDALPGLGLRAQLSTTFSGSFDVLIGNRRLLESHCSSSYSALEAEESIQTRVAEWESQGLTVVYCAMKGRLRLAVGLLDELQPGAMGLIQRLKGQGYQIGCLTGDQPRNTCFLAKRLGIPEHCVWAGLTPLDKQDMIVKIQKGEVRLDQGPAELQPASKDTKSGSSWQSTLLTALSQSPVPYTPVYIKDAEPVVDLERGLPEPAGQQQPQQQEQGAKKRHCVLMIGDGLNDTLALAQADLAIAYAGGSNIQCMSSQQVLLLASPSQMIQSSPIEYLFDILGLARRVRRRISLNFFLSFLYNVFMIPLAMVGRVSPWMASACMAASGMSVTLSSLALSWMASPVRHAADLTLKEGFEGVEQFIVTLTQAQSQVQVQVQAIDEPQVNADGGKRVRKVRFADLPDAKEPMAKESDAMCNTIISNQQARPVMAV